jgi:predicted metal-dependent phosphoesterase TrpH
MPSVDSPVVVVAHAIGLACARCCDHNTVTVWEQRRAGDDVEWVCSCSSSTEWLDTRRCEE